MSCNAVGGGGGGWEVSSFPEKNVTKMYSTTLRGGGWGSNVQEKSVT